MRIAQYFVPSGPQTVVPLIKEETLLLFLRAKVVAKGARGVKAGNHVKVVIIVMDVFLARIAMGVHRVRIADLLKTVVPPRPSLR